MIPRRHLLKQTGTATWRTARFTLILLALSWSNAGAEQVFYRNGKVVPGSVIGYDPATVTVNTGQGTIRIHKDELRRIYYAPTDEEVRKEEEAKKAEAKRKEEEAKRQEEETKRRAEAAKQREEDAKRAEEQKRKDQEEDRLKKEKEAREQAQKKEKQQAEELAAKERQKEEERLERSKGRIKLTGRREFDTVIKEKSGDRLLATSNVGLLTLNLTDVVSMTVSTKSGVQVIKPEEIRGEIENAPKEDEIPLQGGRVIKGTIAGMSGGLVLVNTSKGQLRLRPDEINRTDLKLPGEERAQPTEGFTGTVVLSSGMQVRGKLVIVSPTMTLLETDKGLLQFRTGEISFVKKD